MQKIKCENCGSNDIAIESEEYGVCRNCGTKIKLTPTTQNITVNNNVTLNGDSKNSVLTYSIAKKTFRSDEFLRRFVLELGKNQKVNAEVLDYDFSPVQTSYDNYIVVKGHVNLNYSASIGYDKTIKKQDGYYKTETDWKPFSGTFSDDISCGIYNNERIYEKKITELAEQIKQTELESLENNKEGNYIPPEITADMQNKFKDFLLEESTDRIDFPGDRHKDFSYSGTVKTKKIFIYGLPKYSIKYSAKNEETNVKNKIFSIICLISIIKSMIPVITKHAGASVKGKSYNIKSDENTYSSYAFGNLMTPIQVKSKQKFHNKFLTIKRNKISFILSLLPLLIAAILAETSEALSTLFGMCAFVWWGILLYRSQKFKKSAKKENQELKKNKCNDFLKTHGLSVLTSEEEKLFDIN